MAQHFFICTNSVSEDPDEVCSADERNRITQMLEKRGWPVWHWFEDVWLTVNPKNPISVNTLTRELRKAIGKQRVILVTQIQPISLDGYGPKPGWIWTRENWPGEWD